MRVYLKGGLGNQLFQYSFAHHLLCESSNNMFSIWLDRFPRNDRPFELYELCKHCKHVLSIAKADSGIRGNLHRLLLKVVPNIYSGIKFPIVDRVKEEREYVYKSLTLRDFGKHSVHIGHFQHWKYVESSWPLIKEELFAQLEKLTLPIDLQDSLANLGIIHIRRGDFIDQKNQIGLLSVNYYREAIKRIRSQAKEGLEIIAITDDITLSASILKELEIAKVFCPNDLDAWTSLKLMSHAKYVIMANSTFSWWGGFLAVKRGGVALAPSPWFKNWQEPVGDAFSLPSMQLLDAQFED